MTSAPDSAGNKGSRYQYTVKGDHVQLRCVTFDADSFYESQSDETGSFSSPLILRDATEAGLIARMEANGVPVTDKARAWLADANCADV